MTREQKLLKLADKMVLLAFNSEILSQRILGKQVNIKEIVRATDTLVTTPINTYYSEIIEELRDAEIENLTLDGEAFSPNKLTSNEEWFDMINDLVSQVKEQYLISTNNV